ncbi:hypothetical protein [Rhodoferax sp.]|uniref:hypothetical protein n=1 Tax=Rhodoferax sp. TaxID=50421 RepID=UPI00374D1D4E
MTAAARSVPMLNAIEPETSRYLLWRVRGESVALATPLSDADVSAQAAPEASPTKWHLVWGGSRLSSFDVVSPLSAFRRRSPWWSTPAGTFKFGQRIPAQMVICTGNSIGANILTSISKI